MSIKVFLSYATEDLEILHNIEKALAEIKDIEVLSAPRNIAPGDQWKRQLDSILNTADVVVAITSKSSVISPWVQYELCATYLRNKTIIPLVIEDVSEDRVLWFLKEAQQMKYRNDESEQKDATATLLIKEIGKHITNRRNWLTYCQFHFAEKAITRLSSPFLIGLVIANLGFVLWYAIDHVWELFVRMTGSPLLPGKDDFVGPWPSIWGAFSLITVFIGAWVSTKLRRGRIGYLRNRWLVATIFFMIFGAFSAMLFYNVSGIDSTLKSLGLHVRTVELLSTITWSAVIVFFIILPFILTYPYFQNVFQAKYLLATIPLTILSAVSMVFVYMLFLPISDTHKGILAGMGLRSGMFIGMYIAAVASSIQISELSILPQNKANSADARFSRG